MHRPGSDPDAMSTSDILCDFCARPWDGESLMVEGHRGSCICKSCLREAAGALLDGNGAHQPTVSGDCVLCLRTDRSPVWRSPTGATEANPPGAAACRGCVRRSVRLLDTGASGRDAE